MVFIKKILFDQFAPPALYAKVREHFNNEITMLFESVGGNDDGNFSFIFIGAKERLIYKDNLITGDTLFAYGVGRWDFPTGNLIDLRNSVSKLERIAYERNIMNILPGHGEKGNLSAFSNAKLFL